MEGDVERAHNVKERLNISIHALRVEGDCIFSSSSTILLRFLSTPSEWRATAKYRLEHPTDPTFLSTPSGWRATAQTFHRGSFAKVSIHALRVEGDQRFNPREVGTNCFYPRPPGGGRLATWKKLCKRVTFLSTPSGWRATACTINANCPGDDISIHALRVEGDRPGLGDIINAFIFLSTPSGWRATGRRGNAPAGQADFYPRPPGGGRRAEKQVQQQFAEDFYPRPPGGGRPGHV